MEDEVDPWKKETRDVLSKASDDQIQKMSRDEQIALRRELEICLEKQKHGVPYSNTHYMNEDNPISMIIKGLALMWGANSGPKKKENAMKQIGDVLSKLAEYNASEKNDQIHQINLEKARLKMQLNALTKRALIAADTDDDYTLYVVCPQEGKEIEDRIREIDDQKRQILESQNLQNRQNSHNQQNSHNNDPKKTKSTTKKISKSATKRVSKSATKTISKSPAKEVTISTAKNNAVKGAIAGILGGVGGYGGIKIAQNMMDCKEEEKLTTMETVGVVATCAAGGAIAMIAAPRPAVLTAVGIFGVSSLIGAGAQYAKKHW